MKTEAFFASLPGKKVAFCGIGRSHLPLIDLFLQKKGAFYQNKSHWTDEPMVHIVPHWNFKGLEGKDILVTVYTNCENVTLIVNGAEVETKQAVDHAVVFENVALTDGANTVTAKSCCGVEDTITLNGVAEHNAAYTLPDIAAAMAVGNWFDEVTDNEESDEIVVTEGYYSIEDPFAELAANEECVKCVKGWFMAMGNLTMASMIGAIAGMMGDAKITMLQSMMDGVTQKDFAKLNRLLSRVKK